MLMLPVTAGHVCEIRKAYHYSPHFVGNWGTLLYGVCVCVRRPTADGNSLAVFLAFASRQTSLQQQQQLVAGCLCVRVTVSLRRSTVACPVLVPLASCPAAGLLMPASEVLEAVWLLGASLPCP